MKHDEENKPKKKLKHAPNKPGVGMKILNEHDADELDGVEFEDNWTDDGQVLNEEIDRDILEKYIRK